MLALNSLSKQMNSKRSTRLDHEIPFWDPEDGLDTGSHTLNFISELSSLRK